MASTLGVAALSWHLGSGVGGTLLAAAVWYWLAADAGARRRRGELAAIREHNDAVAGWQATIGECKADLLELRLLEWDERGGHGD